MAVGGEGEVFILAAGLFALALPFLVAMGIAFLIVKYGNKQDPMGAGKPAFWTITIVLGILNYLGVFQGISLWDKRKTGLASLVPPVL